MTITHRFTDTKPYPAYGPRHTITVKAQLEHLHGNARPHFSITAEIGRPGARDVDACGCLHDDILKTWPALAPVIALHLSDDTGQPMHAEANSWYQLAGYYGGADERFHAGNSPRQIWKTDGTFDAYREPTPEECLQSFAEYIRIPLDDARILANSWRCDDDWASSRRWFRQWLTTQADRFQREATAACHLLDTLTAETVTA